jgi:NAD(P)-dependent dehydrogenase (short-subunit alcohol dehydrogenase family)
MKKRILIAGGSSGIGSAAVSMLSEKGYEVTCACRRPEEVLLLPGVSAVAFDANEPNPALELPETLEGFVYFPGTITLKPFQRLGDDDFMHDLQVNLFGAIRLMRLALPALKKAEAASVVFFSTVAVQTGMPFHASIASAKGAVEGLARSLAAELAPRIRVNVIAPSLTNTPLAASLLSSEERAAAASKRHPLNRVGDPAEVAAMVEFLIGSDSGFVTGQVFRMDGGLSSVRRF